MYLRLSDVTSHILSVELQIELNEFSESPRVSQDSSRTMSGKIIHDLQK